MFHFIHSSHIRSVPADAIVLGIEATIPSTIARCTLGNIDPQHGGSDGFVFDDWVTAACLASLDEVVRNTALYALQDGDVYLVTDRVDLDAVATMALLSLFATPGWPHTQPVDQVSAGWKILPSVRRRLNMVASADSFDCGDWPGPRPIPTLESPWLTHGAVVDVEELAAPNWVCGWATPGGGNRLKLEQAVRVVGHWLLHGDADLPDVSERVVGDSIADFVRDIIASDGTTSVLACRYLLACACHDAMAHRIETIRALEAGDVRLDDAHDYLGRLADTEYPRDLYDREYGGDQRAGQLVSLLRAIPRGRAVVTGMNGSRPAPASFAYCIAPISIVEMRDPRTGFRRYSIAAFSQAAWDREDTLRNLLTVEPGWGGGATILGSPQDRDTRLEIMQVLACVVAP